MARHYHSVAFPYNFVVDPHHFVLKPRHFVGRPHHFVPRRFLVSDCFRVGHRFRHFRRRPESAATVVVRRQICRRSGSKRLDPRPGPPPPILRSLSCLSTELRSENIVCGQVHVAAEQRWADGFLNIISGGILTIEKPLEVARPPSRAVPPRPPETPCESQLN